ncbi:hypothetical protein PRK78_000767 [Emydomyces testavorans]|uniref:Uncharacterized protein n=1 Tax=Emydomyces testavorans TaxID=2070801 RepID=A0AAF0DBS8_9EURO|nr:hypothetical protein PRK78_000767 [Emydomyces testavorans]
MPLREKVSLAAVFGVGVAYKVWVWTAVECHLGIICASIPPLRILFKRFLKGTMYGSSYAQNSRSKTTTNPNDSVDKDSKAYPLQNGPRHTKSTEWDKDSNSSSRPLEWPSQKGILRTDNFEVNYNSRHSAKLPPV